MPIDGWIPDISFLAKVHLHQCSTIHVLPSGLHDFQPYDLPILRKDLGAVPALLRRWDSRGTLRGEQHEAGSPGFQVEVLKAKFNHHWWNENETTCSKKKNQKRTERKNRCKKKRKLRSWLVKPTSQQKGHRRSGSFDVDVVAQVFNVVHFLMLHAQVLGSKIVDSRIGPCLKWPKYPKPATFRSSFLTFLVLCSDPT